MPGYSELQRKTRLLVQKLDQLYWHHEHSTLDKAALSLEIETTENQLNEAMNQKIKCREDSKTRIRSNYPSETADIRFGDEDANINNAGLDAEKVETLPGYHLLSDEHQVALDVLIHDFYIDGRVYPDFATELAGQFNADGQAELADVCRNLTTYTRHPGQQSLISSSTAKGTKNLPDNNQEFRAHPETTPTKIPGFTPSDLPDLTHTGGDQISVGEELNKWIHTGGDQIKDNRDKKEHILVTH